MRRRLTPFLSAAVLAATLAASSGVLSAQGASPTAHANAAAKKQLKWGPAPPFLPAGARIAVVEGDPGGTGPFTIHLLLPAGWRIAPHQHPTDENITVVRGKFSYAMGDTYDAAKFKSIARTESVSLPANQNHYARAVGRTEIEIKSTAPFQITYVNAKDDPRNKKGGKPKA